MVEIEDSVPVRGAVALPDADKAPAILLIHEWWGLNDQIKAVAADFAKQGYVALAVDLYEGDVAKAGDAAAALKLLRRTMNDQSKPTETLTSWMKWLRQHERSNGKLGTVGWCFGGGWSLNASIAAPVDATVIYYGNVTRLVDQLKKLQGPVLGHFGKRDKNINEKMVSGFVENMKKAGKGDQLTVHWYDADHAFANPTGGRYDEGAAKQSWERTTAFLKKTLG
jgi:carboxymethylenebutenolidase